MKKRSIIALLLALFVFLSGFATEYDNAEVRSDTEAVLNALIDGDYMAFRASINERVADDELTDFFNRLSAGMAELGEYELTAVAQKIQVQNDLNCIAILYEMTAGNKVYEVEVVKVEGESGLAGFYIEEAEGGIVAEEASWGLIHWVFAAVGVVTVVFTVWMLVDCIRRKMKRKWLWIALILLLTLMLTFKATTDSVNFAFNFGIHLGFTNVRIFTGGGFVATIYVPLGALIYLTQRKKLTIAADTPEQPAGQTPPAVQEELPAADEAEE